jgi:hypothetical protein
MLSAVDTPVPVRVAANLDADEEVTATLRGLMESGFALTQRRLFGWRANGVSGALPLAAIERILVDEGTGGDHLALLVLPRHALHPPLVLTRRANELPTTLAFIGDIGSRAGVEVHTTAFGPIHRFTFPASGGQGVAGDPPGRAGTRRARRADDAHSRTHQRSARGRDQPRPTGPTRRARGGPACCDARRTHAERSLSRHGLRMACRRPRAQRPERRP